MTTERATSPSTTLEPYAPGVRDIALILARARIDDIDLALSSWPRCPSCSRCLPIRRVLRTDQEGSVTRTCCRRCNKVAAVGRWSKRKRAREAEARRLAAALEPEILATEVQAALTPPPTRKVKVYHAGREPLWTTQLVEEPRRARKH